MCITALLLLLLFLISSKTTLVTATRHQTGFKYFKPRKNQTNKCTKKDWVQFKPSCILKNVKN